MIETRGAKNVHTKKFNLHFVSGSGQNFECEWNLVRDHAERQKWKWRWDSHFHLQKCEWNSNFHLHSAAPRRRALLQAITGQITYPRIQYFFLGFCKFINLCLSPQKFFLITLFYLHPFSKSRSNSRSKIWPTEIKARANALLNAPPSKWNPYECFLIFCDILRN